MAKHRNAAKAANLFNNDKDDNVLSYAGRVLNIAVLMAALRHVLMAGSKGFGSAANAGAFLLLHKSSVAQALHIMGPGILQLLKSGGRLGQGLANRLRREEMEKTLSPKERANRKEMIDEMPAFFEGVLTDEAGRKPVKIVTEKNGNKSFHLLEPKCPKGKSSQIPPGASVTMGTIADVLRDDIPPAKCCEKPINVDPEANSGDKSEEKSKEHPITKRLQEMALEDIVDKRAHRRALQNVQRAQEKPMKLAPVNFWHYLMPWTWKGTVEVPAPEGSDQNSAATPPQAPAGSTNPTT